MKWMLLILSQKLIGCTGISSAEQFPVEVSFESKILDVEFYELMFAILNYLIFFFKRTE